MPNSKLLLKLRELHQELAGMNSEMHTAEEVDDQTIDALGQLLTDVNELVDQANDINLNGSTESEDIFDRVITFESKHPRVAQFLSEVTELLNLMGI